MRNIMYFMCNKRSVYVVIMFITVILIGSVIFWFVPNKEHEQQITNFITCASSGNVIMESYPRQCRTQGGEVFVEDIGNEFEKIDLIRLDAPRPNASITSPLTVKGEARGAWFFEGSFPLVLTDWDGRIIAESYATAQDEWMTDGFVPFEAVFEFTVLEHGKRGTLILQKSNPSGLSEYGDTLEIPIRF